MKDNHKTNSFLSEKVKTLHSLKYIRFEILILQPRRIIIQKCNCIQTDDNKENK